MSPHTFRAYAIPINVEIRLRTSQRLPKLLHILFCRGLALPLIQHKNSFERSVIFSLTRPIEIINVLLKSSPTPKESPFFNMWIVRYFLTTLSLLLSMSFLMKSMGGNLSLVLPDNDSLCTIVISLTTLQVPEWMRNTLSGGTSMSPTISCDGSKVERSYCRFSSEKTQSFQYNKEVFVCSKIFGFEHALLFVIFTSAWRINWEDRVGFFFGGGGGGPKFCIHSYLLCLNVEIRRGPSILSLLTLCMYACGVAFIWGSELYRP